MAVRDPRLQKLLGIIDRETEKIALQSQLDIPLDLDTAKTVNAYAATLTRVSAEQRQATKAITADLSKLSNKQLDDYARSLGFKPDDLLKDEDDDDEEAP